MLVPITQSLGHRQSHFMVMDHWSQALDIALFETGTEKWSWMNEGGTERPSFSCAPIPPKKIIGDFSSVTSILGTFICQAWLAGVVCEKVFVAAKRSRLNHRHINWICLTFLHCVFSNASKKWTWVLGTITCRGWLASMWESVCRSKKVAAQPGMLLVGMLAFYVYCTCILSWVRCSTWYADSGVGFLCLLYLYVKLSWVINLVVWWWGCWLAGSFEDYLRRQYHTFKDDLCGKYHTFILQLQRLNYNITLL